MIRKLLIAGSRTVTSYLTVRNYVLSFINKYPGDQVVIITGRANDGPDDMAYHLAKWDLELPYEEYPADWDTHGKSAGYKRNETMGDVCTDGCVVWDGVSRGSKHMINILKDLEKPRQVIIPKADEEPRIQIISPPPPTRKPTDGVDYAGVPF